MSSSSTRAPRFAVQDLVSVRGRPQEVGVVMRVDQVVAGTQYYEVFFGSRRRAERLSERDLEPYVNTPKPTDGLREGRFASIDALRRCITLARLARERPLRNNIFAFNASRTRFYPYQFKPLLKLLESRRQRLLIADEVGLGKTIEAGLILLELKARQSIRLALIVCPAALLSKWQFELDRRFDERYRIMRSVDLFDFCDRYEHSPERITLQGIVSHETLRSVAVRRRLEELRIPLDFMVVDEAHVARNPNATRKVLSVLGDDAGTLLLLTATPIHLGQRDLFSLLNLLDPEDFPDQQTSEARFSDNESLVRAQAMLSQRPPDLDRISELLTLASRSPWLAKDALMPTVLTRIRAIQRRGESPSAEETVALSRDLSELNLLGHVLTRTRKREAHLKVATRRARHVRVSLSARERELYDAISERIRQQVSADTFGAIGWRLCTPQRRMASSMPAMVEYLRENPPDWLAGSDDDSSPDSAEYEQRDSDDAPAGVLGGDIQQLVAAFPSDEPDAKYETLRGVLRDAPGKVLLFATFRHTLRYLRRRLLAVGVRCELITGETEREEREASISRFREDPEVKIMLSSRVGSEGLDFQFCSTVVNYDLPWNPMEVEQRIGRLDRLGQEADVIHIVNVWTNGTIEERILRRLYDRIGIFERSIGELESILGSELGSELQELMDPRLTEVEAQARGDDIVRRLETRRLDVRQLEQAAAQFIGVDNLFEEEVEAIQARRRYVTPILLQRLVEEFLRDRCPRARLTYDSSRGRGTLQPDGELSQLLVRESYTAADTELITSVGRGVPITFDGRVAEEEPKLELIRALHPLIQSIARGDEFGAAPAAYDVELVSELLPEGDYFFGVFKTMVRGAREYNLLEVVVLDMDLKEACTPDTAEELLGELIESGTRRRHELHQELPLFRAAADAIGRSYLERQEETRSREEEGNDAFIDQRLASLRQHFGSLIARDRSLLADGIAKKSQERYLRMLKGRIANREGELKRKVEALEDLRRVVVAHDEVAAGILSVVARGVAR